MGYVGARTSLESAKTASKDDAIQQLSDGLVQLSRAIQNDLEKLQREMHTVASRIR
jgi:hypothetical protein